MPSTNLNYTKLADRNVSFGLIRTNPKLTSNVKLTVDSTGEMWFNSIDATEQLADQKYKLFPINPRSNHETNIFRFYDNGRTPSKISFAVGSSVRTDVLARDLKDQYDFDLYSSGAKYLSADYSEKFSYLAPLYLDKVIPEYFVIFKIPGASNYSTDEWYRKTNDPDFSQTNFAEDLFKKAIIIKSISLKEDSNLGTYLRNIRRNPMYPNYPLYVNFKEDRFSLYRGISINSGTYVEIPELLDSTLRRGLPQLALEKYITSGFERNNVVHPRILNLEFLFDDDTSTDYSINRYIGFYCNAIDLARFDLDLVKMYENDADNDNPVPSVYTKYDDIAVTLTNSRGVVLRGEGVTTDLSFINQSLSDADNLMFPYIRSKGDNLHFIRVNKADPAAQPFSQISSNITFAVDDTSFDIGRLFGPDTLFSQELAQEIVQDTRTTVLLQLQDEPAHLDTIRLYHQNGSTFEANDSHQKYDDIVFVGGFFENGEEYSLEYPIVDQILFDTESPDDFFQTTSSSEHTFGNDTCVLECVDVTGFAEDNTVFVRATGGGYLIGTINTVAGNTLTIDVLEESGSDSSSSWTINRSAQFTPNIQVVSDSGIGSLIPSLGSISVPCNSVDLFEIGNMVKIYQPVNRSYRMAGRITEIDTETLTITVLVDYEYGRLPDSLWIVQRLDLGIQYLSEANGTVWKSNGREFEQGAVGSRIYVNLDNAEKDSLTQTAITIDNTTISDSAVYTFTDKGESTDLIDLSTLTNIESALLIQTQNTIVYEAGQQVQVYNSTTAYFNAIVESYDSETGILAVTIIDSIGTGSFSTWTISLTGDNAPAISAAIGLKTGKIVKIQNSSGGYIKGIVTSVADGQFTIQSRIANIESDFASGFEVLWTVSDTNKLTTSLTKLIGELYSTHLVASTYNESLFIQSRTYGNTHGSLGLRNISESQSFLINGKYTTSTVLADGGLIKPQIIIPVGNIERLSQSLDSLVVKTSANWSSIDRVCNSATYVNNGNGETTGQTVADYLKYATLMIHDEEKVLIDYDKIEIRNIFKPSIGFLSLFEIKDIDFDTYTSRYAKIPEIDLYQYYYIPENTSILDFTQYCYQLVGDGSIAINEIEYIATGSDPVLIWQDREGLHKFSVISGNPVVTLTDTMPGKFYNYNLVKAGRTIDNDYLLFDEAAVNPIVSEADAIAIRSELELLQVPTGSYAKYSNAINLSSYGPDSQLLLAGINLEVNNTSLDYTGITTSVSFSYASITANITNVTISGIDMPVVLAGTPVTLSNVGPITNLNSSTTYFIYNSTATSFNIASTITDALVGSAITDALGTATSGTATNREITVSGTSFSALTPGTAVYLSNTTGIITGLNTTTVYYVYASIAGKSLKLASTEEFATAGTPITTATGTQTAGGKLRGVTNYTNGDIIQLFGNSKNYASCIFDSTIIDELNQIVLILEIIDVYSDGNTISNWSIMKLGEAADANFPKYRLHKLGNPFSYMTARLNEVDLGNNSLMLTVTETFGEPIFGPGWIISQVENITPNTRLDIGILDEDNNLQNFTGFFGLGADHTAPNQNSITYGYRDKYLSNGLLSEYNVYLENFSKDFSTDGRVIPYITKWGIADSTDARGNAYRLNCDITFGKDNFGPSHRETAPTAEKLTHEWFYVESNFNYLLDQELVRKNLYYFDSPLDIDRLISDPAYFEDYFTYVPKFNSSEIDRPQFRYSKLIRNQFTNQYETIFNGAKFIFSEKNASGEILQTTTRFNDYNFSILLKPVKESLANPQNPITYRIIENTNSKSILILIEVAISGIDKIAKNLLIGSYDPLSEFSSGRLDQANLFTSGYSVNKDLITIPVDVVYTTNNSTEGNKAFNILYADETANIDQLELSGIAVNQFTGETISPFNLLAFKNILVKKGSDTSSQLLISTPSGSLFELANNDTLSDFCISGIGEYLTSGTSTNSINPSVLTIGSVLTIQTQTGLGYVKGQLIQIYNSPTSYIDGKVSAYTSGTGELSFSIINRVGSVLTSPWTISLASGAYPYRISRSKRVVSNTRAYKTVRLISDGLSQIYPILLDENGDVPIQRVDANWLSTGGDYRIQFNSEQVSNLTYVFMYSVKDKKYNSLKSSFSTVKLATGVSFSPLGSTSNGSSYSLIAKKLRGLPDFIYGLDSFINPTSGATDLRPAFAPIMMINRAGEIAILLDTRVDLNFATTSDRIIGLADPLLTGHAITTVSENSVTVSSYVDRNRGLPGIRYVSFEPVSYSAADMLADRIDLTNSYIGDTVTILFQNILPTPTISSKYKVNDIIRIENTVSGSATGNYLMAKITEVIPASFIIKAKVYYQSSNTQSGNQWSDLTANSLQVLKPGLSLAATNLSLNLSANPYPVKYTTNDLWTDGYQQFQLFSGKNYFLNLFENLSFANFLKTIRNGSAVLSWETYTDGVKSDGQPISIDVEEADTIEKSQIVSISEEFVEAGNRSQVGGYTATEQLTQKYELFRYSGEYEVLFKSIAGFKYRNQLGEFILDGSNVRLNPGVANFFVIPEFSYVKYSNQNILDLEQSPKFSARYPLIGESPIDYTAFNSLASSWDFGYHYQYFGKSTKTAIAGSNRITEDYSFVSKLINLPLEIMVEPAAFQQITNEEFEVTDQEFANLGIDFAYSIYATDIKLKINLDRLIAKKLISAGLGESFNRFFKAENGSTLQFDAALLGNQTLDEYKLNYCLVNLVKLYTLDTLQCYARPDHTLLDNSASFTQLTYNEIELQGYSQLNTIQINNPKSTILTCSVPKLASTGVSLVPKLKIKYI